MTSLWITALDPDDPGVPFLVALARRYGLGTAGHTWVDDLPGMAWAGAGPELARTGTGAWVILGSPAALARPTVVRGLALLALDLQSRRGHGFPVFLVGRDQPGADPALPTPLAEARRFALGEPSLGAKLAAAANRPAAAAAPDYRLGLHALPGLGLWFEIGPPPDREWSGALFAASGGEIDAHAVGPAGQLPERTVLEYPMKGLELEAGGLRYRAWAVRNRLAAGQSYFVRVKDVSGSIRFGAFDEANEVELFHLQLG
jgi:hypothetical protein